MTMTYDKLIFKYKSWNEKLLVNKNFGSLQIFNLKNILNLRSIHRYINHLEKYYLFHLCRYNPKDINIVFGPKVKIQIIYWIPCSQIPQQHSIT